MYIAFIFITQMMIDGEQAMHEELRDIQKK